MEKETYWSKFADDYEKRAEYVVGLDSVTGVKHMLAKQKCLGRTLELGCGNGTFTNVLRKEADELVATDYSDEMLVYLKDRFKVAENMVVEKANCCELSYPDDSFDTVVMANLLHIIPEPEKAILESQRVLKDGGRLIALSWTKEGLTLIRKLGMIYRYLITWGKPPPDSKSLTVESMQALLRDGGFTSIADACLAGGPISAVFVVAKK